MTLKQKLVQIYNTRKTKHYTPTYFVEFMNHGLCDGLGIIDYPASKAELKRNGGESEPLDFENAECYKLDLVNDSFTFVGGGDWQVCCICEFLWRNNRLELVPGTLRKLKGKINLGKAFYQLDLSQLLGI